MAQDLINSELLEAFFEDARDVLEEWERVALQLTPQDTIKAYEPILRCAHNLKGSAGMTGLGAMHQKIHTVEDYLVQIRDQNRSPDQEIVAVFLSIEKSLRRWVERLKEDPNHVEDMAPVERELARVVSSKKEGAHSAAVPTEESESDPKVTKDAIAPEHKAAAARGEETLRIAASKLDHLIQLVGEISLHQAILDRAGRDGNLNTPTIRGVIDLKSKLVQDLQDAALGLRMIPVQGLFQKVERLARDAAHTLNKQVQVERFGEEVSMDKLVVDGMLEPLIHIARNAIDHGIEGIVERVQIGKNPIGTISIAAENAAGGVTITFKDDGRGINAEKVYEKAVSKGLIEPNDSMPTQSKLQLIFLPGLSTAEQVTEYSGRGVGMDVVSEAVKRMGGRIEILSELGKGTSLTISLPTNISIIDALIVKVNGCQYALPTQDLVEVINLHEFQVQPINGGESRVINLRDKVVSIEDMSSFLDHAGTGIEFVVSDAQPAILVGHRDHHLALAVDAVIGQQQVFVRPLMGHLAPIGFYGGSTILSDGEPTIILNLPEMARKYFTSH